MEEMEAGEGTSYFGEIPNCGPCYILSIKSMSSQKLDEVEKGGEEQVQMGRT